jgi:hypothetical protein
LDRDRRGLNEKWPVKRVAADHLRRSGTLNHYALRDARHDAGQRDGGKTRIDADRIDASRIGIAVVDRLTERPVPSVIAVDD